MHVTSATRREPIRARQTASSAYIRTTPNHSPTFQPFLLARHHHLPTACSLRDTPTIYEMISSAYTILLVTVLTTLLGPLLASSPALASPVPMPLPLMAVDHSHSNLTSNRFAANDAHKSISPKTEHSDSSNHPLHSRLEDNAGHLNAPKSNRGLIGYQSDSLGQILSLCAEADVSITNIREFPGLS
jgi:hypothetical protein